MNKLCTNGSIENPEDFIVEEVISPKFLRKYHRSFGKIKSIEGPYSLFLLRKTSLTTEQALSIVAKHLSVPVHSIGYAGLKDKFAVTSQYVTIKDEDGKLSGFCEENISLEKLGRTNRHIAVGDLIENRFTITLHDCKNLDKISNILEFVKKPIPNYFGPQRFSKNNAELGKKLLKRQSTSAFGKEKAKFLINSYQSFLFNKALSACIKRGKIPVELPLVGYDTKRMPSYINSLLEKDGIALQDFRFGDFSTKGSIRKTFIKAADIKYSVSGGNVVLQFTLPKGSYATVVLNKIQYGKWLI